MSRYTYDDKIVADVLTQLNGTGGVCSSLEKTGTEIQKTIKTISNARKANEVESFVSNKEYLNSLSTTSIDVINELCDRIKNIVTQIEEFENASWWKKFWNSFGLGLSKLFEGFAGVGEGLVDGFGTILAKGGSAIGLDTTGMQEFIAFDYVGTAAHNFNEKTGLSKYSFYSETSTAANIIEGFGTMLGYTALGTVSGGLVGDLVTGYVADLGMSTQAHMNAGSTFDEAVSFARTEAVKGAMFTVALGGIVKSYSKAGKTSLGMVDDVGVKGLGTVDDLDNSVRSMQNSVTGLDNTTGRIANIDGVKDVDIVGSKTIDGKAVEVSVSDAKGASKTTKTGTTIEKYNITDAADSSKKLGEIEVVTKKDGSVIKTTKTIDADTGKTTKTTIEKATKTDAGDLKTTEKITKDYSSGHKKADTTTTITETGDGKFTKTTKEGLRNKVTSTEKIEVTKNADGATTSIKSESFDGKLKSDGTPKKHTSKVGETTETISSGDVQTRVSKSYGADGKVTSTTTDAIDTKTRHTGSIDSASKGDEIVEIKRDVAGADGVVTRSDTIDINRADDGSIKKVDTQEFTVDADGNTKLSSRKNLEYDDGFTTKRETYQFNENGLATDRTVDEIIDSSKNADTKINSETIRSEVTHRDNAVDQVVDEITYKRDVSAKTGKTIDVTSTRVDVDVDTGVKTTIETSANGKGVVNKRVTSSVDAAGARTGDEIIETVNRPGYQRKEVIDANGKKTVTTITARGKEQGRVGALGRVQTSTVGGKHTHFINDSYITGNKVNKLVSKYDDVADRLTTGFRNIADDAHDWLAANKVTKYPTKLYDKVMGSLDNFSSAHPIISNRLDHAAVSALGATVYGFGDNSQIAISNQPIEAGRIDQTQYKKYNNLVSQTQDYDDIYGSDLLAKPESNGKDNLTGNDSSEKPTVDKDNTTDSNNNSTSSSNNSSNSSNNSTSSNNSSTSSNNSSTSSNNNSSNSNSNSTSSNNSSSNGPSNSEEDKKSDKENEEDEKNNIGNEEEDKKSDKENEEDKKADEEKEKEDNNPEQNPSQQNPQQGEESSNSPQQSQPQQSTPQSNPNPAPSYPSYTAPSVSPSNPSTPSVEDTPIDYEELEVLDDGLDDVEDDGLLEDSEFTDETDDSLYTIPTPIEPTETEDSESGGSSVGPILTGLGLAAAAGVGAKIYLDKKKESELEDENEDEEDEIIADEWNEDNDSFDFMNGEDSPFNYQDQDQEA